MELHTKQMHALEANDMQEISQVLQLAQEKLLPFLQEITSDQKGVLAKMSDASYAFALKTMERGYQYPVLVPAFVSLDEMKKQFAFLEQLRHFAAILDPLAKAADDSYTLANSKIYSASLLIYKQVKMAADNNVPGAKSVYDELKKRFENQRVKNTETDVDPTEDTKDTAEN